MVADMAADMGVHMVADMEGVKVADMFADIVAKKGTPNLARRRKKGSTLRVPNLVRELVRGLVNWAQNFSTRTLPDLRVF